VKAESIEQEVLAKLKALPLDQNQMRFCHLNEAIPLLTKPSAISSDEQMRLIRMIVDRVTYDRTTQRIGIELTEAAMACLTSSDEGQAA
jgi:hypothetical protein